jgi:sugar diacid utilization regulator
VTGVDREGIVPRLPADTIADTVGEHVCAIVPDPDGPGRRAALQRAVADAGVTAALGTTVAPPETALSFARARAALGHAGDVPTLVVAREIAGDLLLGSDPRLARELTADRLAPLAGLSAGSRARLLETLIVWLEEQGRLGPVAQRLGVHPQTARYRLTRLRELFGARLDDPDERFWLQLALRVGG